MRPEYEIDEEGDVTEISVSVETLDVSKNANIYKAIKYMLN